MINSKISDHFPGKFVLGDTKNLFLNFHKFQKSGNKTNVLKMKLFFSLPLEHWGIHKSIVIDGNTQNVF